MNKLLVILIGLIIFFNQNAFTSQATSAEVNDSSIQEAVITKNIGTEEFNGYMKDKSQAIILDVRTPGEVTEGYLKGALNIDFSNISFQLYSHFYYELIFVGCLYKLLYVPS